MIYDHEVYLIQLGLKTSGFDPGRADGLRGPKTRKAFEASAAARFGSKRAIKLSEGVGPPIPYPTTLAKVKIFGAAGTPQMEVFKPPYPMTFVWGGKVKSVGCHKMIAAPLKAALIEIGNKGKAWIDKHGLNIYAGCFNYRNSRGGRSLSDHAWAIAIDLNPDDNYNHQTWKPGAKGPAGTYQMPKLAVNIFRKHGFQVGFRRADGTRRDMMHIAYVDRP
tara:strand:- start:353 stop:1012 length:660 start_codon:yes stop_codon:yes gene_type:complete